jgi:methylation protein EvaC
MKFLDLGRQPIANAFLKEEDFDNEFFYDLVVSFNEQTGLVTIDNSILPEDIFNDTYAYHTASSSPMVSHFKGVANDIKKTNPLKILEIGANDGTFIKNFTQNESVAIEPCMNFCNKLRAMGYKTYPYFLDTNLAETILEECGDFEVIYSANCMAHIHDIDEAFAAVKLLLDNNGQFIFEDPSLVSMLYNNSYDQLYDEHAHIFSITALNKLAKKHELKIVEVDKLTTHGGSNRIIMEHESTNTNAQYKLNYMLNEENNFGINEPETYVKFAANAEKSRQELQRIIIEASGRIVSIGATAKSTTIFNYCRFDKNHIECITDTTPAKQGLFSPGCHIPIVSRDSIDINDYKFAFLGAWNFRQEIEYNERTVNGFKGEFITHVPHVEKF